MKNYHLNYYPEFKCIADKCKHTCCAGWEMLIDKQSLDRYLKDLSPFNQALKSGINVKKSKLKTDKNKRCAFLNQSGLCDIITNLGEESLCQVCRDHPRFRSFSSNRIEMGLGFSCEQATSIILSCQNKIEPVLTFDDKKDEKPTFIEQRILEFRDNALNIIQDRSVDINERINNLFSLCKADFTQNNFNKLLKRFLSLEKLDKGWYKRLKSIKKNAFTLTTAQNLSHYCEQFLVNSIYRHLLDAEDTVWVRARLLTCIFSWLIIKSVFETEKNIQNEFELICDIVRAYSTEIEYSQKNLDKIFNFSYKFIKL